MASLHIFNDFDLFSFRILRSVALPRVTRSVALQSRLQVRFESSSLRMQTEAANDGAAVSLPGLTTSILSEESAVVPLPKLEDLPPMVLKPFPPTATLETDEAFVPAGDESDLTPVQSEEEKPAKKARKPRKPRAPKPEPVYEIPDVPKKTTNFKGRLGYACLSQSTSWTS